MECELPAEADLGYNEDHRYSHTAHVNSQEEDDDDEDEEVVPDGVIRPMEEDSVRRIVAGQAVTDLASAVKELVDNALDARSSSINIRLFNQGLDIVEVSDDGCGVPPASRPYLATAHATSKIQHFEDIYNGNSDRLTLGFRGEALFCLANLSEQLAVATRTQDEAMAQQMQFCRDGSLDVDSIRSVPRKVGTTVAVFKLLNAVPVRRTDMTRRIVQQRAKLLRLMEGYAIFSVGVKINLYDVMGTRETVLLSTANSSSIQQTISSVLGSRVLNQLTPVVVDLTPVVRNNKMATTDKDHEDNSNEGRDMFQWKLEGLVSKAPVKGSSNKNNNVRLGQQYFSINGRPVELLKVARILGDVWRTFGGKSKPSCVLTLTLPNNEYDVNLTPEKRQVMLTHEAAICDLIKAGISNLWSRQTDGQFTPSSAMQCPGSPSVKKSNKRPREGKSIVASMAFAAAAAAAADFAGELDNDNDDDKVDPGHGEDAPVSPNTTPRRSAHKRRGGFVHDISNAKVFDRPPPTPKDEFFAMPAIDDEEDDDEEGIGNSVETSHDSEMKNHGDNKNLLNFDGDSRDATVASEEYAEGSTKWIRAMAVEKKTLENDKSSHHESNVSSNGGDHRRWTEMQSRFNHSGPVDPVKDIDNLIKTTSPAKSARVTPSTSNLTAVGSLSSFNLERFAFGAKTHADDELPLASHTTCSMAMAHSEEAERSMKRCRSDFAVTEAQEADVESPAKRQFSDSATATDTEPAILSFESPAFDGSARPPELPASSDRNESPPESSLELPTEGSDDTARPPEIGTPNNGDNGDDSDESPPEPSLESPSTVVWESFTSTADVVAASRVGRLNIARRKRQLQEARGTDAKGKAANMDEDGESDDGRVKFVKLEKGDFAGMKIIGQFNHGFILCLCPKNHLWILDQHACDEKYNFERLVAETIIHEQKLIAPMPLELDPSEENCVLDNIEIFKHNGFRFHFDPDKPPRHRLSLTSLPHSGAQDGRKAVQFGREDVSALCAILGGSSGYDDECDDIILMGPGGGTGTDGSGSFGNNAVRRYAGSSSQVVTKGDTAEKIITRLPKAIAMFASRACRGSIMIGKSLSQSEMEKIVRRLDDVEHPWNCPHGRPTMKYGANLQPVLLRAERDAEKYQSETAAALRMARQEGGEDENNDAEEVEEEENESEED